MAAQAAIGDRDGARRDLLQALRISPGYTDALENLNRLGEE